MAEQEIRLQDIFDMDFIQKLQDGFARAVGMTAVTVDLDGTPVTHPTDWTDFCMKYTRGCPKGKARCEKCDAENGAKAARTTSAAGFSTTAGLACDTSRSGTRFEFISRMRLIRLLTHSQSAAERLPVSIETTFPSFVRMNTLPSR